MFFKTMMIAFLVCMGITSVRAMESGAVVPSSEASYVSENHIADAPPSEVYVEDEPVSLKSLYHLPAEVQHLISLYIKLSPVEFAKLCDPYINTPQEKAHLARVCKLLDENSSKLALYPIGTVLAFYHSLKNSALKRETFNELMAHYSKKIKRPVFKLGPSCKEIIKDIFFSPDGAYIVTHDFAKGYRVWSGKNGMFLKKDWGRMKYSDSVVSINPANGMCCSNARLSKNEYVMIDSFDLGSNATYASLLNSYPRPYEKSYGTIIMPSTYTDTICFALLDQHIHASSWKGKSVFLYDTTKKQKYSSFQSVLGNEDIKLTKQIKAPSGHDPLIIAHAVFNKDGSQLAIAWEKDNKQWRGDSNTYIAVYSANPDSSAGEMKQKFYHEDEVTCMAFSDNSDLLAVGGSGLKLWDPRIGQCLGENSAYVDELALIPQGKIVFVCNTKRPGDIKFYSSPALMYVGHLEMGNYSIGAMKLNFQGTRLAVSLLRPLGSKKSDKVVVYDVAKLNKELYTSKTGLDLYKKKLKQQSKQAKKAKESKQEIEE